MILGLAVVHAFCCGVGACLESWSVRGAKHRCDRQWVGQCVAASTVVKDTEPSTCFQRGEEVRTLQERVACALGFFVV